MSTLLSPKDTIPSLPKKCIPLSDPSTYLPLASVSHLTTPSVASPTVPASWSFVTTALPSAFVPTYISPASTVPVLISLPLIYVKSAPLPIATPPLVTSRVVLSAFIDTPFSVRLNELFVSATVAVTFPNSSTLKLPLAAVMEPSCKVTP